MSTKIHDFVNHYCSAFNTIKTRGFSSDIRSILYVLSYFTLIMPAAIGMVHLINKICLNYTDPSIQKITKLANNTIVPKPNLVPKSSIPDPVVTILNQLKSEQDKKFVSEIYNKYQPSETSCKNLVHLLTSKSHSINDCMSLLDQNIPVDIAIKLMDSCSSVQIPFALEMWKAMNDVKKPDDDEQKCTKITLIYNSDLAYPNFFTNKDSQSLCLAMLKENIDSLTICSCLTIWASNPLPSLLAFQGDELKIFLNDFEYYMNSNEKEKDRFKKALDSLALIRDTSYTITDNMQPLTRSGAHIIHGRLLLAMFRKRFDQKSINCLLRQKLSPENVQILLTLVNGNVPEQIIMQLGTQKLIEMKDPLRRQLIDLCQNNTFKSLLEDGLQNLLNQNINIIEPFLFLSSISNDKTQSGLIWHISHPILIDFLKTTPSNPKIQAFATIWSVLIKKQLDVSKMEKDLLRFFSVKQGDKEWLNPQTYAEFGLTSSDLTNWIPYP